ncbi:hypothetical protein GCM10007160_36930 [Litchfieldella qijiaojingensis]|uniref:Uncharacterized protein n=1 Tax=Litchfieldella qijiaojingensis TaxID=980347 RepID=A0ABQ2Z5V3_9GAMM|nr:hypothetical protein [Halomonas qijiaojingensis]GGY05963.1 hypothetical protein GCM10007160_36930 [Halomonas qijiaojingensis]
MDGNRILTPSIAPDSDGTSLAALRWNRLVGGDNVTMRSYRIVAEVWKG